MTLSVIFSSFVNQEFVLKQLAELKESHRRLQNAFLPFSDPLSSGVGLLTFRGLLSANWALSGLGWVPKSDVLFIFFLFVILAPPKKWWAKSDEFSIFARGYLGPSWKYLGKSKVPWENPGYAIVYCRERGPPVKIPYRRPCSVIAIFGFAPASAFPQLPLLISLSRFPMFPMFLAQTLDSRYKNYIKERVRAFRITIRSR